ncbi:DUF5677 domain-containing protein [Bacillus cereus]|uniref:DUF5677 domain-containing protein n=1 Tax=Bacillus cereus TaxID=1396 RepID=UPI001F1104B5|nr:DUF5677 domain-containing protein [Bacillus cereus]MCH5460923.1 DUF5677 domain-containing protein [Bacillus cereus]
MTNQLEVLSKCIQFGDEMLEKLKNKPNLPLEHKVIISLYRKLIEQLDGNYALADHELPGPTKVMIRSAFETYLSIKYIIKDKKFIKDRALCYYICYGKSQISVANQLISDPIEGVNIEDLKESIKKYEQLLKEPVLKKVSTEWDRTKNEVSKYKKFDPPWYALFDGPTSIKQLLEEIEDNDDYRFYSALSQEAHGYQAINGLINTDIINEPFELKPIRCAVSGDLQEHLARALCTTISFLIIKLIAPEYEQEVLVFAKEIGVIDKIYHFQIPDMTIQNK